MCPPPKKKQKKSSYIFWANNFSYIIFFFKCRQLLQNKLTCKKVYFIVHIQCPEFGVWQPYNNYWRRFQYNLDLSNSSIHLSHKWITLMSSFIKTLKVDNSKIKQWFFSFKNLSLEILVIAHVTEEIQF